MSNFTPHGYQQRGIAAVETGQSVGLFMEPGLGKTVTTLTALQSLIKSGQANNVLILAPKRVVEDTWPKEIDKWGHIDLTYSVVLGTPKARVAALKEDVDLYLMNYENIQWLFDLLPSVESWPFDTVVLDESSKVKSSTSKRFKTLKKLHAHTTRFIALTGTPSPNGMFDLWSQAFLLDGGKRLGKSFYAYRARYFHQPNPYGYAWVPNVGAAEKIAGLIQDICVSMKADDYLSLPSFNVVPIEVDLPSGARATYDAMHNDMVAWITETDVVDAANAAVMTGKCLQIANGALYLPPDEDGARSSEWHHVHDVKIAALESIYSELNGAPLLVAYMYKHDQERLVKAFPDAVDIKEPGAIDRWNRGEIAMLLAHPASAGHGLNLQDGGNHLCWFGLNWSLELYEQFNARLHRQGQTKPVFAYHIMANDTVDHAVLDRLTNKRSVQESLKYLLKERAA